MLISDAHNLVRPGRRTERGSFGVRVSLPADDPFMRLLDSDWNRTHWFVTAEERDAALQDMQRRHEYSRDTDTPALVFKAIERDADEP